ncbi:1-acyl-sn-glycerol-3-phosphate acyltransferase 2-like isoform X2 [Mangifera indica]|uniref:1-acyl-sn-glycerol-3-phosphate acyltransferase 2-like isoform X2 n=1 Tax=Mangifera indica TaxID=29780 RepID=UPI001CFC24FF|nr:1-acyl-sn-glycerol-3-phosphate acyltransferase 2-like isoform X2 [Mangifera indica]
MAIAAAAVIVPLGLLFFISGLVVNLIQGVFFVFIKPLSKSWYRRINKEVAELLWLELIWLLDWWAGIKVKLYTDCETLKLMGKEHALVISNHKSDIDWLVGWVLAQRSGCLGSALAVMKKSSKFLPVIGWSMWFSEYLFLERSWAKDEGKIKSGLQRLKDFPRSFWLALFVEGTRFTQAKLLAAQEYAASNGLPIPRNVLIPRTKVHVHLKRHLMKELPESDDAVAQWCKDVFVAKDSLLDKHNAEDTFSGQELQEIPRPLKPLLVVVSWVCLVIFGALKFLQWSSLLSSWKGIAISAFCLATVTVLMHILILFSQSERSTPAKVAPAKPKNISKPGELRQDKQQ